MKSSSSTQFLLPAILLVSSALMGACGGGAPTAESAASEDAPVKFDAMSPPQKMKHMKEVVTPKMAEVFGEMGGADDFSCTTCHGPGAKDGSFEMPSASIAPLDKAEMDAHPEATQFMKERVVPEMAALMGEEPYNPETHEGFGCFDCHTKKE